MRFQEEIQISTQFLSRKRECSVKKRTILLMDCQMIHLLMFELFGTNVSNSISGNRSQEKTNFLSNLKLKNAQKMLE